MSEMPVVQVPKVKVLFPDFNALSLVFCRKMERKRKSRITF